VVCSAADAEPAPRQITGAAAATSRAARAIRRLRGRDMVLLVHVVIAFNRFAALRAVEREFRS
jgi:hypothetical protein